MKFNKALKSVSTTEEKLVESNPKEIGKYLTDTENQKKSVEELVAAFGAISYKDGKTGEHKIPSLDQLSKYLLKNYRIDVSKNLNLSKALEQGVKMANQDLTDPGLKAKIDAENKAALAHRPPEEQIRR